ncbi:MAG: GLUG motif-containing protein, partial [Sedimentisphaerales bacterium]
MNAGKITAITVLLSLLSFFVLPDCVEAKYSGGSGTAGNPYKIGKAADLLSLAANTGDYGKYFILIADINLASHNFTTAVIARDTNPSNEDFDGTAFTGVFDGNNHIISNLTINTHGAGNDYLGLFGCFYGEVENLRLKNVSVTGGEDSIILGGLMGLNGGDVNNCYITADINSGSGSSSLGGLAGGNFTTIINCYSTGNISGDNNSTSLGGLIGNNYGDVNNCYSKSIITSGHHSVLLGGLVGWNGGTISDCYSTGAVTGGDNSEYLGGLVGWNNGGTTSNCYSTGIVSSGSGSVGIGGLAGANSGGSIISHCYFLTGSGPNNGLGTPLTDAQMKQQSSFVGLDFVGETANGTDNIWAIIEGIDYPKLSALGTYSGGTGAADDPFQIATVADLLTLATNTKNYDKSFILTADINLAPAGTFTTAVIAPDTNIGSTFVGIAFTGVFNGNNHIISNLTINTSGHDNDYLGLFGKIYLGGQITNLGLENVSITGGTDSYALGGLAGTTWGSTISNCFSTGTVTGHSNVGGLVGYNGGDITNCYSTGNIIYCGNHSADLAGLVGHNGHGSISSCHSTCDVNGGNNPIFLGGLVGVLDGGTITNCYSTGALTGGNFSQTLGGLVGTSSSAISNSYSTGVVIGGTTSSELGGLVGNNNYSGTISNCYATGAVTGGNNSYDLGGLVGDNDCNISDSYATGTVTSGDNSNYLGGLTGWNTSGSNIDNCRSTGTVSGGASSNHLGGLAGDNDGNISNCFSTAAVSSEHNSEDLGGLVGLGGGSISDSYSTGDVTGGDSSKYLGGLIARDWTGASISRCYSTSTIKGGDGAQYLGGLIGFDNAGGVSNCYSTGDVTGESSSKYLGGLVGENFSATINHCYSTGDVNGGSGASNLGGLAGINSGGSFNSCYFLAGSGPADGNGTPLTDTQMKHQASFSGWDFVDTWRIRENVSFPKLHISDYSGGSGTSGEPYKIATVADLLAMAANTADYDANFVLMADINLINAGVFTTAVIAPDTNNTNYDFDGTAFTGVFDGNNHTISNLTINTGGAQNDFLGLFGEIYSGGEIKNLRLKNVNITGGPDSILLGGLAGINNGNISNCCSTGAVTGGNSSSNLGGLVGYNEGNIRDCFSTDVISGGVLSIDFGGLVGHNSGGTINNCYSTGAVSGGNGSYYIGGLSGLLDGGDISNCYATGTVTCGDSSHDLGGLVGRSHGDVSNCCSTGAVTGGDGSQGLGGLAGWTESGDISASCSTGTVTGGSSAMYLGGLVGWHESGDISDCFSMGSISSDNTSSVVGGLVGYNNHGNITNCYSTGAVPESSNNKGNLVGHNNIFDVSITISNCYYLLNKGGFTYNSYGSPLTAAKMKKQTSFSGWDFISEIANGTDDIWWIAESSGYPKLFWQLDVAKCTVTAGSKPNTDKISFSGTMGAVADDFVGATFKVTIYSNDIVSPCVLTFPIDTKTFKVKNGTYSYSKTVSGVKKSFTYSVKTHKFAFSASNVDLSGLGCPLTVEIEIDDYFGTAQMDEAIVNGLKMPIPIKLMMGVKNVLRVDKCTVKQGKKAGTDQLSANGGFAVENQDVNMPDRVSENLVITLGTQTFTIPANKLKPGKGKFTCSN